LITKPNDHRQFSHVTCDNGLNVLLVHDKTATQSAIAATIAAGHFQDPKNCPGLAHLLEHCLFSGCKRYPQENQINNFVESSGGSINAWTAAEMTGFEISCHHQDLLRCSEMLSNMLSEPLFPENALSKEIQAIHAEFTLKQHDEPRRIHQIDKETSNPDHPFHQFSSGHESIYNQFTPSELVHMLKTFHQNWYHTPLMQLCVVSSFSLAEMREQLLPFFENLSSDFDAPLPSEQLANSATPIYKDQDLGKLIQIQTQKNINQLAISFLLPDIHQWYRTKPELMLSHLLGDENDGSLYKWLRNQGWISQLSAGNGIQGSHFKDYTINLHLTPAGLSHIVDIIEALFWYVHLIESAKDSSWRFAELQQLNQLDFEFQEPSKPVNLASHMAVQMQYYPPEHYLAGEYLLDEHDFTRVKKLISYMTPQNMRVRLAGQHVEVNQFSTWYKIPFSVRGIAQNWMQRFNDPKAINEITLPQPNPYLTHNLSLVQVNPELTLPQKLISKRTRELWFGQDDEFHHPKSELFISFDSPVFNQTSAESAYSKVWASSAQSWINDRFYSAATAGIFSHLYPHKRGFTLHCAGFSEHQLAVAYSIMEALHKPHTIAPYIEKAKIQRLNTLRNSLLNRPINRLFSTLNTLMHEHSYLTEELAEFVEVASSDNVSAVSTQLTESFCQSLFYGNWKKQDVLAFDERLSSHHKATQDVRNQYQILNLKEVDVSLVQLTCAHDDAAIVSYLQGLSASMTDKAMCIMLEHLLSPNYFQYMRVQKQYGYEVGCGYLPYFNTPGLTLYIQSPTTNAHVLYEETMGFLSHMPGLIANLPEEMWRKAQASVVRKFSARDQNFSMKCQRLWTAMDADNQCFDEPPQIAALIEQMKPEDPATYLAKMLSRKCGNLTIFTAGKPNIIPMQGQTQFVTAQIFQELKQQRLHSKK